VSLVKNQLEDFPFYFMLFFLAAIALSKTLDYYADAETSDMSSSPVVSTNGNDESDNEDETTEKNNRNLYDKAGKSKTIAGRRGPSGSNQEGDDDANIVSSNIKTIVVICSKETLRDSN
jgi:hypothetical protein